MKILTNRLFWGIALLVGGGLLLLESFGILKDTSLLWTIITLAAGIYFLSVFFNNHAHWWALIPGVILIVFGITIGVETFLPTFVAAHLTGPIILIGIGLPFLLVYLVERSNWWAIIPAGVMFTIGSVAIISLFHSGSVGGGVFFLGLALTFVAVALLPNPMGRMWWAWIPAAILAIFGVLILAAAQNLINYVWPGGLILVGVWLVVRSLRKANP